MRRRDDQRRILSRDRMSKRAEKTTMTYTLSRQAHTTLKRALTRALNSDDPEKVLAVCERARLVFNFSGFPDDWSRWERPLHELAMNKDPDIAKKAARCLALWN